MTLPGTNMNDGPWSYALQQSCWKGYSIVDNGTDRYLNTCVFPTIPLYGLSWNFIYGYIACLGDKHRIKTKEQTKHIPI